MREGCGQYYNDFKATVASLVPRLSLSNYTVRGCISETINYTRYMYTCTYTYTCGESHDTYRERETVDAHTLYKQE